MDPFATEPSTSRASPPRFKRVAVTSCDSCRLRKLKCNAKELPAGSTCSSCAKHEWQCTFEDSKESLNRPTTRMRHKIHRNPNPPQPGIYPHHFPASASSVGQQHGFPLSGLLGAPAPESPPQTGIHPHYFPESAPPVDGLPHTGLLAAPAPEQSNHLDRNSNAQAIYRLAQQLWPHVHVQAHAPSYGWSSGTDAALSHPQDAFTPSGTRDPRLIDPSFNHALHILPIISKLSLPPTLTNPETGITQSMPVTQVAVVLLLRFYADPTTSLASVVPRKQFLQRYQTCLPAPPPPYLLITMLTLAAFLPTTKEPELLAWRGHGWSQAIQAIQVRLHNGVPVCTTVFQTLLLLGIGWVGGPDDRERMIILDMARRAFVFLDGNLDIPASPEPQEDQDWRRSDSGAAAAAAAAGDTVNPVPPEFLTPQIPTSLPIVSAPTVGPSSSSSNAGGGAPQPYDSFLPPASFPTDLGHFGATSSAAMTPFPFSFQAVQPPVDTITSPTSASAIANDLDWSALGLKGLMDGLDPLHDIWSDLAAFDFAHMGAIGEAGESSTSAVEPNTSNGATPAEETLWLGLGKGGAGSSNSAQGLP
ncbi:hypothetical protein OC861_001540 [Tilletia horrida]|nr:hypothetical protein OC861_001540 [Tilletia horrida]